jgi:hypothetical protein
LGHPSRSSGSACCGRTPRGGWGRCSWPSTPTSTARSPSRRSRAATPRTLADDNPAVLPFELSLKPGNPARQLQVGISLTNLGDVFIRTGCTDEAITAFGHFLEIFERLVPKHPAVVEYRNAG